MGYNDTIEAGNIIRTWLNSNGQATIEFIAAISILFLIWYLFIKKN